MHLWLEIQVPQHYPGYDNLGKWVASQRKNYTKMRKGRHSAMTSERAFRLSEIGFVWNAMYKIRKRSAREDDSDEEGYSPRRTKKPRRRADDSDSSGSEEVDSPRRYFGYS
jgi:hypothetical protein